VSLSWLVGPLSAFSSRPRFLGITPFCPTVPGSACVRPRYRVVFFHSPASPVVSLQPLFFQRGTLDLGGTGASARGPSSFRPFAGSTLHPPCIGPVLGTCCCSILSSFWRHASSFVAGFLILGLFGPLPVLVPSFRMASSRQIA